MNKNYQKDLLVRQLAMSKAQFYLRTASVYKLSLEVAEGGFFSQFSIAIKSFLNEGKTYFNTAITKNLQKLKYYLNEINEALENGDSKLYQAYQTALKEEKIKIKALKKSPFFYQACKEVDKKLGYVGLGQLPISEAKNYELKIEGEAERGQQIFQHIKNSIVSQPEWNFPINGENYTRKVEEKIKELEGKKDHPQPKEDELKTHFSQWQKEREINPNNCPEQLKEVLSIVNNKQENSEGEENEIIKIIVKLKLEIAELNTKYKVADLVPSN
ncbi:255_t:CDS:2 [Funneliformis geosporum]|uniref:255_t:CDS:1 n=1 Tax=Funneliformis geosporum TaxID=1117311 RepID=A0A9W4SLZ8_9GLOM|nr:255_t:CDS:2 [Funneliformis geosporum]